MPFPLFLAILGTAIAVPWERLPVTVNLLFAVALVALATIFRGSQK